MSGFLIATLLETSMRGHGGTFALTVPDSATPDWIDDALRTRAAELLGNCDGMGPVSRVLLSLNRVQASTCRLTCTWLILRGRHDREALRRLVTVELVHLLRDLDRTPQQAAAA